MSDLVPPMINTSLFITNVFPQMPSQPVYINQQQQSPPHVSMANNNCADLPQANIGSSAAHNVTVIPGASVSNPLAEQKKGVPADKSSSQVETKSSLARETPCATSEPVTKSSAPVVVDISKIVVQTPSMMDAVAAAPGSNELEKATSQPAAEKDIHREVSSAIEETKKPAGEKAEDEGKLAEQNKPVVPQKRGRGRPPGSRNKKKIAQEEEERRKREEKLKEKVSLLEQFGLPNDEEHLKDIIQNPSGMARMRLILD